MSNEIYNLENQLNSFNYDERISAIERLNSMAISFPAAKDEVNLHYHTFFSYNANGWSPLRIAWEAKKYGLLVAGIVDFDVLDGMEEFLSAGELLDLRTISGLETRIFIKELADKVISSPNEPGIAYFMASGCYRYPEKGTRPFEIFSSMRQMAQERNISLIQRINAYLDEAQIDYQNDVIPLTPAGNATERHILVAYDQKARKVFCNDHIRLIKYWAEKLQSNEMHIQEIINDSAIFHELMRAKLMKYGSVGYIAPDTGSFPSLEDAIEMVLGMGALPMIAWLDGTNPGEQDTDAFIDLMVSKGVSAINIIPERNWNIKDPAEKALKLKKLDEIINGARRMHLPISVGTEMNKPGLPFVDNFKCPELAPYVKDFVEGALCIYGHTIMARYADAGFFSEYANDKFGDDRAAKVSYYTEIGRRGIQIGKRTKMREPVQKVPIETFIF